MVEILRERLGVLQGHINLAPWLPRPSRHPELKSRFPTRAHDPQVVSLSETSGRESPPLGFIDFIVNLVSSCASPHSIGHFGPRGSIGVLPDVIEVFVFARKSSCNLRQRNHGSKPLVVFGELCEEAGEMQLNTSGLAVSHFIKRESRIAPLFFEVLRTLGPCSARERSNGTPTEAVRSRR